MTTKIAEPTISDALNKLLVVLGYTLQKRGAQSYGNRYVFEGQIQIVLDKNYPNKEIYDVERQKIADQFVLGNPKWKWEDVNCGSMALQHSSCKKIARVTPFGELVGA